MTKYLKCHIKIATKLFTGATVNRIYRHIKQNWSPLLFWWFWHTFNWKKARFPPQLWPVYDRVINQDSPTTNFLEGLHRRFSTIVDVHHSKFLSKLTGKQAHTEMSGREILHWEDPYPHPHSSPKEVCN